MTVTHIFHIFKILLKDEKEESTSLNNQERGNRLGNSSNSFFDLVKAMSLNFKYFKD